MFEHILVPADLTERSAEGIRMAARILSDCGSGQKQGRISLLHVIERIMEDTEEDFSELYEDLREKARSKLRELCREAGEVPTEIHIVIGSRVEEIVRFVSEQEVDLTVLSSHRIDPENPAEGWGTISHKVAVLAPCPVMLVK